jgi:putative transposase
MSSDRQLKRSFRFLLRPTVRQAGLLSAMLASHRELYNAALEERREAWRRLGVSITFASQSAQLPGIRAARPDVRMWSAASQQTTLRRLDRAFAAFFRRMRNGEVPGFPRFKGAGRFDSVTWKQVGDGCQWNPETGRVYLQGVGHVRVHAHRAAEGRIKTLTIKREGRRWFLVLSCDNVAARPLPPARAMVGLDLGVVNFIATSDGEFISNPRHLSASAQHLASAQRALSRKQPKSRRRQKGKERVSTIHRRIRNQRRDYHHKVALQLVSRYEVLCHEALRPSKLTRSASGSVKNPGYNVSQKVGLNRAILDVGWSQFLAILADKAACAGRTVIAVDPRRTSQTCAECGYLERGNRATQAAFHCLSCGHDAHADVNAAQNILRLGLSRRLALTALREAVPD